MSKSAFDALDGRRISVEMAINGKLVNFHGIAAYERHPDLGSVLKIHVIEPTGNFDLVISEDRWKGKIEEDRQSVGDYRISMTAADLCPRS